MKVFEFLIGQDHIIEELSRAVKAAKKSETSQAMTNSWLFLGPPGSGRSNAAVAFAAALVCKESGCGKCVDCITVLASTHVDVERFNPTGLSIKAEEVRELVSRSSWSPSVGGFRIIIVEEADRLTEAAANALLKSIEEPESHTIWLLCAPALADMSITIRSRCRQLLLHTPSTKSVEEFLRKQTKVDEKTIKFAARISQGHFGRARYLATNLEAQSRRREIFSIPSRLKDIESCFKAAQKLLDIAEDQAEKENAEFDSAELERLQIAYKGTGRSLVAGGAKAIKNLEKEQKSNASRSIRDNIDLALLDLSTFYRDVLVLQCNGSEIFNVDHELEIKKFAEMDQAQRTIARIDAILAARINLSRNAAPLAALEALFCALK